MAEKLVTLSNLATFKQKIEEMISNNGGGSSSGGAVETEETLKEVTLVFSDKASVVSGWEAEHENDDPMPEMQQGDATYTRVWLKVYGTEANILSALNSIITQTNGQGNTIPTLDDLDNLSTFITQIQQQANGMNVLFIAIMYMSSNPYLSVTVTRSTNIDCVTDYDDSFNLIEMALNSGTGSGYLNISGMDMESVTVTNSLFKNHTTGVTTSGGSSLADATEFDVLLAANIIELDNQTINGHVIELGSDDTISNNILNLNA